MFTYGKKTYVKLYREFFSFIAQKDTVREGIEELILLEGCGIIQVITFGGKRYSLRLRSILYATSVNVNLVFFSKARKNRFCITVNNDENDPDVSTIESCHNAVDV